MPKISGIDFIKSIRGQFPEIIFIIITAYANLHDALAAVNEVSVYRFLSKPWNENLLQNTLNEAVDTFRLRRKNKVLIEELKSRNEELEVAYSKAHMSDHLKMLILNNLSHEVRTPLNGIMGFTQLLINQCGDKLVKEYSNYIIDSSERLLGIFDDIILVSLIQAGDVKAKHELFSPEKVLQDLESNFHSRISSSLAKVKIVLDETAEKGCVISDREKIYKIISELFDNALKFTTAGEINVSCQINKVNGKAMLLVKVMDTGLAIDAENIRYIFDPFFQVLQKEGLISGNGLGLTICKAFVEILDGSITAVSEFGKGSVFEVNIPVLLSE